MAAPLTPHATAAHEATQALERALASSQSQWGDSTRQTFDQRHADVAVASGRKVACELSTLAQDLSAAFALLQQ